MKQMQRLAIIFAGFFALGLAHGQTYPLRTVKLIVPFAAGGPADYFARFLAQRLQERMGQPFVVDNRPGAGSVIGTDAGAKSPPDGYSLLVVSNAQTVNETLIANKPYSLTRDLIAVASLNSSELVLVGHPSLKANDVRSLVAQARGAPGKLNYASAGPGTPYHLAGELFKSMAGVYLVHIPYRGSTGARTDLVAGQVDLMFDAIPTMLEQIRSGKVKAIATSGRQRSEVLPAIPTLSEAGVPGYEATVWLGLMAPKGTPPEVVDVLNKSISAALDQPDLKAAWIRQGASPLIMNASQFDDFIRRDIAKWASVIKAANITSD